MLTKRFDEIGAQRISPPQSLMKSVPLSPVLHEGGGDYVVPPPLRHSECSVLYLRQRHTTVGYRV